MGRKTQPTKLAPVEIYFAESGKSWFFHRGISRRVGLMVNVILVDSVFASRAVGRVFAPRPGHIKDHHKMVRTSSLLGMHALG